MRIHPQESLVGRVIGPWTVISQAAKPNHTKEQGRWWTCECSCTRKTREVISTGRLTTGRREKGCAMCAGRHGGARRENGRNCNEAYNTWRGMRERCSNPNHTIFANYGGRGIRVCAEWDNSFPAFLRDMGERPKGCTLDRIDPNGNYEPSNCRWADPKTQARNKLRPTLTDEQIAIILKLGASGVSKYDLATLTGMSRVYVNMIITGSAKRSPASAGTRST